MSKEKKKMGPRIAHLGEHQAKERQKMEQHDQKNSRMASKA